MALMTTDLRLRRSNITSQSGENGVIAAIFEAIGIRSKTCVEFGAYDATKYSNVNPLWVDQGFMAVMIEGDPVVADRVRGQIDALVKSGKAKGTAMVITRWVAPSGANSLDSILAELDGTATAVPKDVDLVSIDIDSVDYGVWEGLKNYKPRVVVIEHNPTVPPHLSIIGDGKPPRVGASARALYELGKKKGYTLVACTTFNCFFVPDEYAGKFSAAGDLLAHFEPSHLIYVMRAFDGGMFYSSRQRPAYSLRPDEIARINDGQGLATRPSDLAGLFRHPKLILSRAVRRLTGRGAG